MGNNSRSVSEIISLPKGGGALHGIGEKFSPDLFTGTGNFTVPIALPPGRNGFQPELNLVYSTGNGNGPFGLGWALSIPGVARKTSKGVPRYDDDNDIFILSGAEDLVPVETTEEFTRYRPRTERLFARIRRYKDAEDDYWKVESKDGLVSHYGTERPEDAADDWQDPAVISDPDPAKRDKVFAWKLTKTEDPFGNLIVYEYERDWQEGRWDQLYLKRIRYINYDRDGETKFLVSVTFHYQERPDQFSEYRPGFEIRTTRRCNLIEIRTHPDQHCEEYETGILVRTYRLIYLDEREDRQDQLPLNGVSLLSQIGVVGHDESQENEEDRTQELPPLEFGYTRFQPEERDFLPLKGDLPAQSLADPNLELVDLFGNGLLDILEMNGTVRYWRNIGDGKFDLPREMSDAPAGLRLSDDGVQMIDANGDGRADLLVTTLAMSGYYPTRFGAAWDRRSFQRYRLAPSFSLEDPEVRLLDLDGDGVTDAIRSGTRLECYFNDPKEGWNGTRRVERQAIDEFPNINFSDPRVKWADMSGDGLQDIVLVYEGNVEYWPNLGHGDWGPRVSMRDCPRFAYGYDPKRILVGDVDGDGLADVVYVDDTKITLWINQSGNSWSDPIEIRGTPPVSDLDAVRLADLLGTGISGILWTKDRGLAGRDHYFFLDLTGGTKPYLLHKMDNHTGAVTCVEYSPSTRCFLEDEKHGETRWKTPLPFPVQVVSRVEVIDFFSKGKLTTEYSYHHGYWDGAEREFRGFGRVDQRDTEVFEDYHSPGLHPETEFEPVQEGMFSPPLETRTWFHQGPIGDEFGEWKEADYSHEFWTEDPNLLTRPSEMEKWLKALPRPLKREALRSLRGRILRTELYALDGTERQGRPYTVTEYLHGVTSLPVGQPWPEEPEEWRKEVFFPHSLAQRVTQWERGDDPMTQFTFREEYDKYGQPRKQIQIACPRDWRAPDDRPGEPYLATCTDTVYTEPVDPRVYIHDRVARTTTHEIEKETTINQRLTKIKEMSKEPESLHIIGQVLNFYDGEAFTGLEFGKVGEYGALAKSEALVLTDEILEQAYKSGDEVLDPPEIPPYLVHTGPVEWPDEYPTAFRERVEQLPGLAGYVYHSDGDYATGYFATTERRHYDFHQDDNNKKCGLLMATKDPLGHETTISYRKDDEVLYDLLPTKVTNPVGLTIETNYDYRVLQPRLVTDPNNNRTAYGFTPLGLLKHTAVMGAKDQPIGDWIGESDNGPLYEPSTILQYYFLAFQERGQPISVRTIRREYHVNELLDSESERNTAIETLEFSDGFGRLLQSRAQAEDVVFGDPVFGNQVLPADQNDEEGTLKPVVGRRRSPKDPVNVVVSGWQIYDNKGQVVHKYEPFFATGWDYKPPIEEQLGQKLIMFYDPRGQVVRTKNPDNSTQLVIYGVPGTISVPDLSDPSVFEPTPWEAYTYDPNDNAGITHAAESAPYQTHWNTPTSVVIDGLGRTTETVQRNGTNPATQWYRTVSTYDIRGNVLTFSDPLKRLAFQHVYDLLDNALRIQNLDAGVRRLILDAAGSVVERRDSKGALILKSYDTLNRPIRKWARDQGAEFVTLREHLIYGDSADTPLTTAQAVNSNLLGKLYRHYDEAGLSETTNFDFKGNILETCRKNIRDEVVLAVFASLQADWQVNVFRVDWEPPSGEDLQAHAATLLDTIAFQTSLQYDALNRMKCMRYPEDADGERKEFLPIYNRAGALASVLMDGDNYIQQIAYNAIGQRILIAYGNGIFTRYAYDPTTFRLQRMRSERFMKPNALTYMPQGRTLQDMTYEYDLQGNVLSLHDRTPGSGIAPQPDHLDREFTYDPIYRLLSATGRECDAPNGMPPWQDKPRCTDMTRTRVYKEIYHYDCVGNLKLLQHRTNGGDFKRKFTLVAGTNALRALKIGTYSYPYSYDSAGNVIQEATTRFLEWDHSDRLRCFRIQAGNSEPSIYTHYLYDGTGQRVKKITRKSGASVNTTVRIGDMFEYRTAQSGGLSRNNNQIHIMDDETRIAVKRIGDPMPGDNGPLVQYHLGDHLGSSHVVIDQFGDWTNHEDFTPFGETSYGGFTKKRYRFTGKERDEHSGLYYYGARYYAPHLGRWMSCDPMLTMDVATLYNFVHNNPMNRLDSNGMVDSPVQPVVMEPAKAEIIEASGAAEATVAYAYQAAHKLQMQAHKSFRQGKYEEAFNQLRNAAWWWNEYSTLSRESRSRAAMGYWAVSGGICGAAVVGGVGAGLYGSLSPVTLLKAAVATESAMDVGNVAAASYDVYINPMSAQSWAGLGLALMDLASGPLPIGDINTARVAEKRGRRSSTSSLLPPHENPPPAGSGEGWKIVTLRPGTTLYAVGSPGKTNIQWGAFQEKTLLDYCRGNQWKCSWGSVSSKFSEGRTPIFEYRIDITKPTKVWMGKVSTQPEVQLPHLGAQKMQFYRAGGLGTPVMERIMGWVPSKQ